MIQQPYYTLADLDPEERQSFDIVAETQMQKFEKIKTRYCRSDLELWLKRELRYCRNIIREVAEAKELEQNLASVAQLSNCGTPPAIKQPSKWEYVYAVKYYDVFERELDVLQYAKSEEQQHENNEQQRGRKANLDFKCCICDPTADEIVLQALHAKADGTKGKLFAYTIYAAVKADLIIKPQYNQCVSEFGKIGNRQGYYKYIKEANGEHCKYVTDTLILQPLVTYFNEIKESILKKKA